VSAADPTKHLHALVKRLRAKHAEPVPTAAPTWDDVEPIAGELVFSLLLAEATSSLACGAFERLREAFVDLNELRIALPHEISERLGEAYPQSHERAARIKASLMDIYQREHAVTLAMLADAGKRESRQYLESLNGSTPFVVARLKLLRLGGIPVPVDGVMLSRLHKEHALDEGATCDSAADWIPKQFEPGQSLPIHALFQAWQDSDSDADKPERTAAKRSKGTGTNAGKKPAKKAKRTKAS
jgi:hypothetical protein